MKRRDPNSSWYGFSLGSNSQKPNSAPKKDKKKQGSSNFSPTQAKDRILTGETMELKNATTYIAKPDRVTIRNDKPYAAVHQFGLPAKVFGKKAFTMKARPFIGKSEVLEAKIYKEIQKGIQKIKEK